MQNNTTFPFYLQFKKSLLSSNLSLKKVPLAAVSLYLHGQKLDDNKHVTEYVYQTSNSEKKLVSNPTNIILRLEFASVLFPIVYYHHVHLAFIFISMPLHPI